MSGSFSRACVAALAVVMAACGREGQRRTEALPQQAYIWQRVWGDPVSESANLSKEWLDGYHVLSAELRLEEEKIRVTRVRPRLRDLAQTEREIGVAIRIYDSLATKAWDEASIDAVKEVVVEVLEEARSGGVKVAEVQLDYDCPS